MEKPKVEKHHHHILPNKLILIIGGSLLVLTFVTVWVAHIDLGRLNFFIAMFVATVKASLVALFFMNLKYDRPENGVIFSTSFLFLAIFIVLTGTDLFFRGDVYVKAGALASTSRSKLTKPWISTPDLIAHGKELFSQQCVTCHGPEGRGDGPAAAALNPHPRNFTSTAGWKNGRKPTMVFKTLKEGLPGSAMASFATLPPDDRWALAHFVLSRGPKPEPDTPTDLAKIGIDPSKAGGGETEAASIPIEFAMERIASAEPRAAHAFHGGGGEEPASVGGRLYQKLECASCHGLHGEGGIKVKNLGVNPVAFVTTEPFRNSTLPSGEGFNQLVIQGLPGDLMPGNGQLSGAELRELSQYVRSLAK